MNRFILVWVAFLAGCTGPRHKAFAATGKPEPAVFYVATNGNDGWSGHRLSRNWRKTDGPFATVPRAIEAAREWKRQDDAAQPITIFIRGGSYFLSEPLTLKPEDSGVTLAAYRNEKPIVSGGRRIDGWKEVAIAGKTLWVAEIPEVSQGKWLFRELWVNGKRAVRARYPNKGYLSIGELPDKTPDWSHGQTDAHRERRAADDRRALRAAPELRASLGLAVGAGSLHGDRDRRWTADDRAPPFAARRQLLPALRQLPALAKIAVRPLP